MVRSQADLNRTFANKGIVEKGLGHLFIASSSSHLFTKTDFQQNLFKEAPHFPL